MIQNDDASSKQPHSPQQPIQHEAEFTGSPWKNPYVVYIILNTVLFLFLVLMAYLAWTNDWIPHRNS